VGWDGGVFIGDFPFLLLREMCVVVFLFVDFVFLWYKLFDMLKRNSFLALLLLVPAPSVGVAVGMIAAPNLFGRSVFFFSKIWILVLPVFWRFFVDKEKLSLSVHGKGGFGVAGLLGVVISFAMFVLYFGLGKYLIEPEMVKDMAVSVGLDDVRTYLIGAVYWILVNSVLEEYVWRWFVVEKCKVLFPEKAAIVLSAFFFTIHHVVAMQIFFSGVLVLIASVGVFVGGVIWSWCYNRYESIWPGYLCHAIVDVAIFVIGYMLIFC